MRGDDRRGFFKKMAGAAVGLATADAVLEVPAHGAEPAETAAAARSFGGGRFAIEIQGVTQGFLDSFEGGDARATTVTQPGEGCLRQKHIAGVKFADMEMELGTGMSSGFYDWIASFFGCQTTRKDGAIVAADFRLQEVSRLTFSQALITEVGLPALDASAKDAAKMTLKIAPEVTRRLAGSGTPVLSCASNKQKKWLTSNFRLTIDGLDCTRVQKVDAFTVTRTFLEGTGDREGLPGPLEVPDLFVTLPEAAAQSFFDWHEDFVINGNSSSESEKSGKLEFLSANLQQALFTVNFSGLGIFLLTPDKVEVGVDAVRQVRAGMYCNQMTLTVGKGAVGC